MPSSTLMTRQNKTLRLQLTLELWTPAFLNHQNSFSPISLAKPVWYIYLDVTTTAAFTLRCVIVGFSVLLMDSFGSLIHFVVFLVAAVFISALYRSCLLFHSSYLILFFLHLSFGEAVCNHRFC